MLKRETEKEEKLIKREIVTDTETVKGRKRMNDRQRRQTEKE